MYDNKEIIEIAKSSYFNYSKFINNNNSLREEIEQNYIRLVNFLNNSDDKALTKYMLAGGKNLEGVESIIRNSAYNNLNNKYNFSLNQQSKRDLNDIFLLINDLKSFEKNLQKAEFQNQLNDKPILTYFGSQLKEKSDYYLKHLDSEILNKNKDIKYFLNTNANYLKGLAKINLIDEKDIREYEKKFIINEMKVLMNEENDFNEFEINDLLKDRFKTILKCADNIYGFELKNNEVYKKFNSFFEDKKIDPSYITYKQVNNENFKKDILEFDNLSISLKEIINLNDSNKFNSNFILKNLIEKENFEELKKVYSLDYDNILKSDTKLTTLAIVIITNEIIKNLKHENKINDYIKDINNPEIQKLVNKCFEVKKCSIKNLEQYIKKELPNELNLFNENKAMFGKEFAEQSIIVNFNPFKIKEDNISEEKYSEILNNLRNYSLIKYPDLNLTLSIGSELSELKKINEKPFDNLIVDDKSLEVKKSKINKSNIEITN